jgi:hypothetical protein
MLRLRNAGKNPEDESSVWGTGVNALVKTDELNVKCSELL